MFFKTIKMKKLAASFFFSVSVLQMNSQIVSPANGSFMYHTKLFQIPSERGPAIPINAIYSGGIPVNQPASEIGLGWSINAAAAIYRSVSGFPDDMKGFMTTDLSTGED